MHLGWQPRPSSLLKNGGMSWAKDGNDHAQYAEFVAERAAEASYCWVGSLLLVASYWPTALADQHNPAVAKGMNSMSKVVFSRTLDKASWNNAKLVRGDIVSREADPEADKDQGFQAREGRPMLRAGGVSRDSKQFEDE
jgi:hypothetical protein